MNNIHILFHVKSVRAAAFVNFVTAVIGTEAEENIMILPAGIYLFRQLGIERNITVKGGKVIEEYTIGNN